MDDDFDELFAYLTFFKICKAYQSLRKQRHERLKSVTKTVQPEEPKRNFYMFSQANKEAKVAKQLHETKANIGTRYENPIAKIEESQHFSPPAEESLCINDEPSSFGHEAKEELSNSQMQVEEHTEQLEYSEHAEQLEDSEHYEEFQETNDEAVIQEINNESCDMIEAVVEDVNNTANETEELCAQATDIEIFVVSDDESDTVTQDFDLPEEQAETSTVSVPIKRKRRRRRPGDPPLSPLPKTKKKMTRRYRIRPENRNRLRDSYFWTVFKEIKSNDEARFFQHVKMTHKTYDALLKLIFVPLHVKRQSVMTGERLAITLMYLAHGMHFNTISQKFKVGRTTVRFVVLQTCEVLWDVLSPIYMRDPTSEDYAQIAKGFKKQWNIPNCAGVLGTRRVPFVTSRKVPGYKFKEVIDVVLMTTCDAKHIFRQTTITVEPHQSQLFKSIINNTLPFPPGQPLDGDSSSSDFPYYFIGNVAFPQRPNLMSPFIGEMLTERNSIYNSCLSCGQDVSDIAFTILTSTWRVLLTNEGFSIENWETVVKACVVLHNFVMINEKSRWYQSNGRIKPNWSDNIPQEEFLSGWLDKQHPVKYLPYLETCQKTGSEPNKSGLEAREILSDYFCVEET